MGKYIAQAALFVVYIILLAPRVFALTRMAAYSTIVVYIYVGVRWLIMVVFTIKVDCDAGDDFSGDECKVGLLNMCRAALYVFVDIDFNRENTYRWFYSIGVQVIMLIECAYVIDLTWHMPRRGLDEYYQCVDIPMYGTVATIVFMFLIYPVFLVVFALCTGNFNCE